MSQTDYVSKKKELPWPRCTTFMKNGGTYTYGVVDGIVGPTTKAFWGPPF